MHEPATTEGRWFAVRCVFHDGSREAYEERITLWRASNLDDALALAEAEATEYVRDIDATTYLGLAQAFELVDQPGQGAEIFSLIRVSELPPNKYISAFFDTGTERQQTT